MGSPGNGWAQQEWPSRQRMGGPLASGWVATTTPSRQRLGPYYHVCCGRPYLPVSSRRSNFAAFRFMPCSEPEEEWALL